MILTHIFLIDGDAVGRTEYIQICRAVGMGFVVMGFIGYFVKLVSIHQPKEQQRQGRALSALDGIW